PVTRRRPASPGVPRRLLPRRTIGRVFIILLHRLLLRHARRALRLELPGTFALHESWKAIRCRGLGTVWPLCAEDTNNGCSGWQELIRQRRATAVVNHLNRERPDARERNVAVHAWAGRPDRFQLRRHRVIRVTSEHEAVPIHSCLSRLIARRPLGRLPGRFRLVTVCVHPLPTARIELRTG